MAPAAAAQAPVIAGFSPASGVAGTTLTISGSNLDTASSVLIGSAKAPIVTDSPGSIQATIPAGATTGVVSVITAAGKATTTIALTTLAVSSFSPTRAPHDTTVTINGSGFTPSSTVQANGVQAVILKETPTQLQITWPQMATSGPISVTNTSTPVGTVASATSFTVTPFIAPTISSFTPASDITGNSVTITGTSFAGTSTVRFGTRAATFRIVSPTQITATVPDGAINGTISVTTAAGTATSTTSFVPALSIVGISPAAGVAGTSVTVTGAGFTSSSTVTFSGTPATVMSRTLPGRLVVMVPVAAPSGPILVTNTAAPAGTVESAAKFNPKICGTTVAPPTYKHVIVIMEENHSFGDIIGSLSAPYINALASHCGLATIFHSITHPSLPEYIAATSGLTLSELGPFVSDCSPSVTCQSGADNIFHQASSWKSYAEAMPSNCALANSGLYAPRHNPALYYTDLAGCATNDVPLGTTSSSPLLNDLQVDASAPSVAWVTPNLCNDMHGVNVTCPGGAALIQAGDNWLKQWLPLITSTPAYAAGDTAVFVIWDEGEGANAVGGEHCAASPDPSCRVPAIVVAPSVKTGTRSGASFNHYSLLKTIEDLLGVPELDSAATAASMAAAFNL